jgi:hypothetical protein
MSSKTSLPTLAPPAPVVLRTEGRAPVPLTTQPAPGAVPLLTLARQGYLSRRGGSGLIVRQGGSGKIIVETYT